MLLTVLALSGGASAQEIPPTGGPIAIPADEPAPPPRRGPRRRGLDGDTPSQDLAHAQAIRDYRDQYLSLRQVGETSVGVDYTYVPATGWGPYGRPRMGWRAVPYTYAVHSTEWAVFQGRQRLDVPGTYAALGEQSTADALERKIRANRTAANVGYGVGVAGVVASVVGMIGADQARSWPEFRTWGTVSLTGVGMMVGGFVGGTFPGAHARRLQFDHEKAFDLPDLERQFDDHNALLASQLGLSQSEAALIEKR
jgi:hypothetical protein